ncbi:alpha-ketoglutarate dehydrogenase component 4 [Condylostylus longicornis]|uniref:alpha-ketoglutarate dehydrogenase component 4 n=1 Tax=Condylostylus longicornis TaxID=2530218 RepID=UPI00244E2B76|nr:alpha-ketoglutarate dehydrogenase component 4 [Condylostylus longicornis]
MVFKTLYQLATKRIPLIKFRKGGLIASGTSQSSAATATASGGMSSGHKVSTAPAIEDWQLPARYRRRPLDPVEIDYINRGGPP